MMISLLVDMVGGAARFLLKYSCRPALLLIISGSDMVGAVIKRVDRVLKFDPQRGWTAHE